MEADNQYSEQWQYDDRFQIRVLALMLRDPTFLSRHINVIKHTYFETQTLSTLCYIVLDHYKKRETIPCKDELLCLTKDYSQKYDRDGSKKLEQQLNHWCEYLYCLEKIDEQFISSRILRFGQMQAIRLSLMAAVDDLEAVRPTDESNDFGEKILRRVESACSVGADTDLGLDWANMALDLPAIVQNSAQFQNKVRTGLPSLDKMLSDGPGAGELAVIMGLPNAGKSTYLACISTAGAYFLKDKAKKSGGPVKAVVHVTCEMSEIATALKFGAAATGIPIQDVKFGADNYPMKVSPELDKQAPVYIKKFSPGTTSVEELGWFVSNLRMVKGIEVGLVTLDYADRLKGGEDDRFRGMGQIYDGLIRLGEKFECPVWTGTQARRDSYGSQESGVIGMSGVAESWKKAEAADIMLSLNQTAFEKEHNVLRLYGVKVRDGSPGQEVTVRWDPSRCLLREMTEEEFRDFEEAQDTHIATSEVAGGGRSGGGYSKASSTPRRKKKGEDYLPDAPDVEVDGSDFFDTL